MDPLPELPHIDLSSVTPLDIEAALPALNDEQKQAWKQQMAMIQMLTQSNVEADIQLRTVLANVGAFARSIGLILTVARAV